MSKFVTRGVVLRAVDYKETDRILTLLTPEGKVTAKARGVRRKGSPLAAACQLLTHAELTLFSYRERCTVNEADPLDAFWGVRGDVELLSLGSYFAEVCETVGQEGVPQPELLSLILNSLYALDKLSKPQPLVKAAFDLKAACLSGYEPMLTACAVCGKEPECPAFHLREGLLHCTACREQVGEGISMPLTPAAAAAMRHVVYGDPKRLFSFTLDEGSMGKMGDACEAFLMTQLERGFHTLDFYKQIKTMPR